MFLWAILLAGPAILPAALLLRSDLPTIAGEFLLVVGVVTLFLAICAGETIGSGGARRPAAE